MTFPWSVAVRLQEVPARHAGLAGVGGAVREPSRRSHPEGRGTGVFQLLVVLLVHVVRHVTSCIVALSRPLFLQREDCTGPRLDALAGLPPSKIESARFCFANRHARLHSR